LLLFERSGCSKYLAIYNTQHSSGFLGYAHDRLVVDTVAFSYH